MRKLFVALLSIALLLGIAAAVNISASAAGPAPAKDFDYTVKEGGIQITDYKGSATDLIVPDTIDGKPVTIIGHSAFLNETGLNSIQLPASVETIMPDAFKGCKNATEIDIPETVSSLGNEVFYGCESLEKVILPYNISAVPNYLCYNCSSLKTVSIPDLLGSIGAYAFCNCTSLEEFYIPISISNIGTGAFQGCSNLAKVTIFNSLKKIESSAFNDCPILRYVYFRGSQAEWNTLQTSIGSDNDNLKNAKYKYFWLNSEYPAPSFEYCIYSENIIITRCNAYSPEVVVPSEIEGIPVRYLASGSFCDNASIEEISLPSGIREINSCAFENCPKLKTINIPDTVTHIGERAFQSCTSLEEITIPSSVDTLFQYLFNGCTALKTVTLSEGVKEIGKYAFNGCVALEDINLPSTLETIDEGAFYDCGALCEITIPDNIKTINSPFNGFAEGFSFIFNCNNKVASDFAEANPSIVYDPVHDFDIKVIDATCSTKGYTLHSCIRCDFSFKDNYTPKNDNHKYKTVITKATTTKNGNKVPTCSLCGKTKTATTIAKASNVKMEYSAYAYSGKVKSPKVIVKDSSGKTISSSNYTLSWSNSKPKSIGKYSVTVKFKNYYSGSKKLTFKIIPGKVTGLKQAKVTATTMKLSWSKVTGAKYYAVQYSKDGKTWSFATKATSAVSFIVKNLKAGTKYKFRVKALDSSKKFTGSYSSILTKWTLCSAPKISRLYSANSKNATVIWSKVTGAKKYIIFTSTDNKNWKKAKTVTSTSATLTGLTSGKKIYVKIQAVNADGLKSAYSGAWQVVVK